MNILGFPKKRITNTQIEVLWQRINNYRLIFSSLSDIQATERVLSAISTSKKRDIMEIFSFYSISLENPIHFKRKIDLLNTQNKIQIIIANELKREPILNQLFKTISENFRANPKSHLIKVILLMEISLNEMLDLYDFYYWYENQW